MIKIYVYNNEIETGTDGKTYLENAGEFETEEEAVAWFNSLYDTNDYSYGFVPPENGYTYFVK